MRLVNVNYIDVEQYEYYVGRPIYDGGTLLLKSNLKLTTSYVELLLKKGIEYIYVEDKVSEGIDIEETLPMESHQKFKGVIKEQFEKVKEKKGTGVSLNIMSQTVDELLDIIAGKKDLTYSVSKLRDKDDYIYEHSIHVAASCAYLGILLKYDRSKLYQLVLGAFFHDIGKIFLDKKLFNRDSNLTVEEKMEIQKHPELGYRYVSDRMGDAMPVPSKQVILQHHERWDGNGYPNQLTAGRIYEMARVCSICNVFDKLTVPGSRQRLVPEYLAAEYLYSMGESEFDHKLVNVFLSKLIKYKEGTLVKMTDKSKGIVYAQNKGTLERPVIRILIDKDGKSMKSTGAFRDLSEEKTLFIEKSIDSLVEN